MQKTTFIFLYEGQTGLQLEDDNTVVNIVIDIVEFLTYSHFDWGGVN